MNIYQIISLFFFCLLFNIVSAQNDEDDLSPEELKIYEEEVEAYEKEYERRREANLAKWREKMRKNKRLDRSGKTVYIVPDWLHDVGMDIPSKEKIKARRKGLDASTGNSSEEENKDSETSSSGDNSEVTDEGSTTNSSQDHLKETDEELDASTGNSSEEEASEGSEISSSEDNSEEADEGPTTNSSQDHLKEVSEQSTIFSSVAESMAMNAQVAKDKQKYLDDYGSNLTAAQRHRLKEEIIFYKNGGFNAYSAPYNYSSPAQKNNLNRINEEYKQNNNQFYAESAIEIIDGFRTIFEENRLRKQREEQRIRDRRARREAELARDDEIKKNDLNSIRDFLIKSEIFLQNLYKGGLPRIYDGDADYVYYIIVSYYNGKVIELDEVKVGLDESKRLPFRDELINYVRSITGKKIITVYGPFDDNNNLNKFNSDFRDNARDNGFQVHSNYGLGDNYDRNRFMVGEPSDNYDAFGNIIPNSEMLNSDSLEIQNDSEEILSYIVRECEAAISLEDYETALFLLSDLSFIIEKINNNQVYLAKFNYLKSKTFASLGLWEQSQESIEEYFKVASQKHQDYISARYLYEFISKKGLAFYKKGTSLLGLYTKKDILAIAREERCIFTVPTGNQIGLMNTDGIIITSHTYDEIEGFDDDGISVVRKGNLYGYIDIDGNEITPIIYSSADVFKDDMAMVSFKSYFILENEHQPFVYYGYINRKGEEVIPFQFIEADYFSSGLAYVQISWERNAFINKKGEIQFYYKDHTYRGPHHFVEDRFMAYEYKKGSYKYGYMDKNGRIVIKPIYNEVKPYKNGIAEVLKGKKWIRIDKSGERVK